MYIYTDTIIYSIVFSIFNLRSSAPKIEKLPPFFDLRPRGMGRRSNGRKGWHFFKDGKEVLRK